MLLVLRLEDATRFLLREVQCQKIMWVISCSYQISEQVPDPELMNFFASFMIGHGDQYSSWMDPGYLVQSVPLG
jgi:hypothetical protein